MTSDQLRSLDEFHRTCVNLSTRRVEDDQRVRNFRVAKRITWIFLLSLSFLAFYLLDKMSEALSLL